MYQLFKKFLTERIADFRRIVRQARGEVDLEDLQSSAWIVATELGEKRKTDIDFANEEDREWVLATLYNQSVRGGKSVRYAFSIDQARNGGDEELPSLAETLPAPKTSDPLHALLYLERYEAHAQANDLILDASFSQAVAYAISLEKFSDLEALSIFLAISKEALSQRIARATFSLRLQASLFDGIERISRSFIPKQGRQILVAPETKSESGQLTLPDFV